MGLEEFSGTGVEYEEELKRFGQGTDDDGGAGEAAIAARGTECVANIDGNGDGDDGVGWPFLGPRLPKPREMPEVCLEVVVKSLLLFLEEEKKRLGCLKTKARMW